MAESTAQEPVKDYIPQEYIEIEPVTAYCNWVLGKPFKDSIAKLDTAGVIAYVDQIKSLKPRSTHSYLLCFKLQQPNH